MTNHISQAGNAPVGRPSRRPPQYTSACTHIRMDRLYGNWPCDLCRYPSPLNWLYCCTSDVPQVGDFAFLKHLKHPVSPFGETLRQEGISESHIKQWEEGGYTDQQLEHLIQQKKHVQEVIEKLTRSPHMAGEEMSIFDCHTVADELSEDNRCEFKVCHHCRPDYAVRCCMSFEAVFEDEIRPIDDYEVDQGLPVKNSRVMTRLGLRRPLPSISTRGLDGSTYGMADHLPASDFSSDGFTTDEEFDDESCDQDFSGSSHDGNDNSETHARDMPFVTLREPRRAETPRCTIRLVPGSSIPRRLRRVPASINDESPSHSHTTSSSISLPTIPTTTSYTTLPGYEEEIRKLGTHPHKALTDPDFYAGPSADQSSAFEFGASMSRESSFGSEVAVQGGLALTEEAVRTHTPDLLTQV